MLVVAEESINVEERERRGSNGYRREGRPDSACRGLGEGCLGLGMFIRQTRRDEKDTES